MKLMETVGAMVIVGIVSTLGYNSFTGMVAKSKLHSALTTITATARVSRYDASETPSTLCFRQQEQVEFVAIAGNDCEAATGWQALSVDVQIDRTHTTLRTVRGVAGNGGSLYRMSWANTAAGMGASWGQLGKLVLSSGSQHSCLSLRDTQGNLAIQSDGKCRRLNR